MDIAIVLSLDADIPSEGAALSESAEGILKRY